ncbi:hypothetical protein J2S92_001230 [Arthrobacter bambusae]|nr:hypothetical protein [Arthrobacter bambusae]MDQ0235230.1 hypothetical protein [Arthrobacter bambusae]
MTGLGGLVAYPAWAVSRYANHQLGFNLRSGVLFVVIAGALFVAGAPFPVFVVFFCAAFALNIAFVVIWARRDALAAYCQIESEP